MNRTLRLTSSLILVLAIAGCGGSETVPLAPQDGNPFAEYTVGVAGSFEVVTWNLHFFAEDAHNEEVALVAQAILAMDADLVAVQEIAQPTRFNQLLGQLPGWSGYLAGPDGFEIGYVWCDSTVTVNAVRSIYTDQWRAFHRPPLVLELTWQDHDLVVINNHLMCCGDGILDRDDPDDRENRRWQACLLLEEWIATEHPDESVLLVGDLNDSIIDEDPHNVFEPFLMQPQLYRFADLAVALGPPSGWSWRGSSSNSHLDHILVTDELFGALAADGTKCYTVRLDRALDGEYDDKMSDHLPVALVVPGSALP